MSDEERRRYSRHVMLPEIGVAGQEKLKAARVLCLGAAPGAGFAARGALSRGGGRRGIGSGLWMTIGSPFTRLTGNC